MSTLLRMTVLPCLLLAGFMSLPANAQTKDPLIAPYFAHVVISGSTCQGFSITVLDSSSPTRTVFQESGRTFMTRDTLLGKIYAVPGFDPKRDKIQESEIPCELAGTVYSEPNQGNPAGNPDDELKKKKAVQLAMEARQNSLTSPAAAQKAQQVKPMNRPNLPRGTQDRTLAPPQNPGTRQTAPTTPRP